MGQDGSILLLGGQIDPNCRKKQRGCTGWAANQTMERVTPGKSEVVFSIKHGDNKNGCAVQPVPGERSSYWGVEHASIVQAILILMWRGMIKPVTWDPCLTCSPPGEIAVR